MIIWCRTTERT